MRFSHFFISRPIFAIVLSLFITIVGAVAYFALPVAQYPEVAPPTIQVTASYPGASAEVLSKTVATPLEQQLNGIENLLYFSSQSTGDGKLVVTLTFKLGTDLSTAESLTQSRVLIAQPRLPEPVQQLGLTVKKVASDYLIVPHLFSPDGSRDQLYLSNYATLHIKDAIARLDGVGDVQTFGARDYAMRIWLDPAKVAADDLTAAERPGFGRRAGAAASRIIRCVPDQRRNPGPSDRSRAVRRHHRQVRRRRPGDPGPRHRPRRTGRARLQRQRLQGPCPVGADPDLPQARLERTDHRTRDPQDHGHVGQGVSARRRV